MQQSQLETVSHNNNFFNEFENIFPSDQSLTLIHAFTNMDKLINKQTVIADVHSKDINNIKEELNFFKENNKNLKTDIKKDLLVEIATKEDISNLNTFH